MSKAKTTKTTTGVRGSGRDSAKPRSRVRPKGDGSAAGRSAEVAKKSRKPSGNGLEAQTLVRRARRPGADETGFIDLAEEGKAQPESSKLQTQTNTGRRTEFVPRPEYGPS